MKTKMLQEQNQTDNNEVGREIGEKNKEASESEMADIIYQEIYSATTSFIWLHE